MGLFRREFQLATKLRLRVFARMRGVSRSDILMVIDGISDPDDFAGICVSYEAQSGKALPVLEPAVGGPVLDLLKDLLAWLQSEEGLAFLRFILMLFGLFL